MDLPDPNRGEASRILSQFGSLKDWHSRELVELAKVHALLAIHGELVEIRKMLGVAPDGDWRNHRPPDDGRILGGASDLEPGRIEDRGR